jgi:hypothetical protein
LPVGSTIRLTVEVQAPSFCIPCRFSVPANWCMCIRRWCSKMFILPIRCIRFEFSGSSIMLIRAIHKLEDRQYGFRFDWWELKQFILIFFFTGIVDRRFVNKWAQYNQDLHTRCLAMHHGCRHWRADASRNSMYGCTSSSSSHFVEAARRDADPAGHARSAVVQWKCCWMLPLYFSLFMYFFCSINTARYYACIAAAGFLSLFARAPARSASCSRWLPMLSSSVFLKNCFYVGG